MSTLTEKAIRDARPGDVLNDQTVRGLSLRAFPERKMFYLYYRTKARQERRPKIGEWGQITLTQARAIAREMLAEVTLGRDPAARVAAQAEPTLTDLWNEFRKRRGLGKKSADNDKGNWDRYLEPRFGRKKLSAITYEGISDMMADMAGTPIAANRARTLLSTMFNFARRPLRWIEHNPAEGVERYKEDKRCRYMRGEEAARIAEALDAASHRQPAAVAFIYLLILTGARKGEIAAARWDWIEGNTIRLPDSKTGAKTIFLPPQAVEVLGRLPRTTGTITGIKDPKKLWGNVRIAAGCPDLRLHDLRHSFASAALAAGLSLAQIGELLGHRNTQTTKRYAHLVEDVATAAATLAADRISLAMRRSAFTPSELLED